MYTLHPTTKKKRDAGGIMAAVILLAGVVAFGYMLMPAPASTASPAARTAFSVDRSDACLMSQKFVRQNLKAPTTALFPSSTFDNCMTTQSGVTWRVRSFVDAQNSFGAMIRSDYNVEMRYSPSSDTWALVDIAIIAP